MKLEKGMVGKYIRTHWDCVGARDGILVDVDDDGKFGRFLALRELKQKASTLVR